MIFGDVRRFKLAVVYVLARPAQPGGLGGDGDGVGLGVGGVLVFRPGVASVCLAGSPPLGLLPAFGTVGIFAGGGMTIGAP